MTLEDALFNWLQMKVVAERRQEDLAARDTYQFFTEILTADHGLEQIEVLEEGVVYVVRYTLGGTREEKSFPAEFVHQLYVDIEHEPKYNE